MLRVESKATHHLVLVSKSRSSLLTKRKVNEKPNQTTVALNIMAIKELGKPATPVVIEVKPISQDKEILLRV